MGTDFNVKPLGAPVAAPVIRPQPDAARNGVQTELPAPKTTTAPDSSAGMRNSSQQSNAASYSNQIFVDRNAGEVVYRVVDNRTSLVVRQFPDEARLRSRAYQRAQDEAKPTKQRGDDQSKLDLTA
jgi:hypothetical protein